MDFGPFLGQNKTFVTRCHLGLSELVNGILYCFYDPPIEKIINRLIDNDNNHYAALLKMHTRLVVSTCAAVPLCSVSLYPANGFVQYKKLVICQHELLWHHISQLVNLVLTLLKFTRWFHCPSHTLISHEWASWKWRNYPQGQVYKC